MKNLKSIVSRRALFAAAAAGALAGCQTTKPPFAEPGVARGGPVLSPAFAQVTAGQHLPHGGMHMGNRPNLMAQGPMMSPGMAMSGQPMPMMNQGMTPVMGSGGMAYPVNYSPSGMTMPAMGSSSMPMMMPQQPMMMGQQPMMMPPPPVMMPGQPGMVSNGMPATPAQPQMMMVHTSTGPQYVMVEAMAPATAPPAGSAPTTIIAEPTPATLPASVPAAPTATEPQPPTPPTFTAPPPAAVPAVGMPLSGEAKKIADPAPSNLSLKPPSGPVLPVSTAGSPGPSLGNYPAAPTKSTPPSPSLPPASRAVDDDIPAAPVFVPQGK